MLFQIFIEELRSVKSHLRLLYQQLLSLFTHIGLNSNDVKNNTILETLQEVSLLKQNRQTEISQELLESHLAIGSKIVLIYNLD